MTEEQARAHFENLCLQSDLEGVISRLSDAEVRSIHKWLVKHNINGGVPRMMRGLFEVEACKRFLKGGDR